MQTTDMAISQVETNAYETARLSEQVSKDAEQGGESEKNESHPGHAETERSRLGVSEQQQVEALIEQGTEIPYQESASSGAATIQFKKAVLSLKVTPLITPDNRLILDINVKKQRVGQVIVTTGGVNVPSIDTSEITTTVFIGDGQTVEVRIEERPM